MGGGDTGAAAVYDAALTKRQAMMGKSGPAALVKNFRVFRVAAFACIGGVLYGYNQGMFSGVLAMPSFGKRTLLFFSFLFFPCFTHCRDGGGFNI
jgi:hypothetical protein